jgi:site-specific DNA-methyltransferase (adenine-specific)
MNNGATAPAVASPRLTPAEEGERAAWREENDYHPDPANNCLDLIANQVFHGDCLQVLRALPDACADLVLTDPPYITRYRSRDGRTIANDDNSHWLFPAFAELYRVLKPNSYCLSFYGWGKAHRFISAWRECGFQPVGHFVWVKRYASCVRHTKMKHEQAYLLAKGNPPQPKSPPDDVLPWRYTGNVLHPTQKSADSLMPIIQAYSKPGGIVLDPFAGSGSTGVAARRCGRRFILIEKVAAYYRAAHQRLISPNTNPIK